MSQAQMRSQLKKLTDEAVVTSLFSSSIFEVIVREGVH